MWGPDSWGFQLTSWVWGGVQRHRWVSSVCFSAPALTSALWRGLRQCWLLLWPSACSSSVTCQCPQWTQAVPTGNFYTCSNHSGANLGHDRPRTRRQGSVQTGLRLDQVRHGTPIPLPPLWGHLSVPLPPHYLPRS